MFRPWHSIAAVFFALALVLAGCGDPADDTDQPGLSVSSHSDGATVATASLQLRGDGPPNAQIIQDISFAPDRRTTANAYGSWVLTVDLQEGPNDLKLRIGSDEETTKTIRIVYDPDLVALANAETSQPADAPSAAAQSTLRPAADATARPTPQPTPPPTPRPTPVPTPQPTANVGANEFGAFATHVSLEAPALVAGLEDVGGAANDFDIDRLTDASVDLWLALGDEVAWLAANGPAPCYAETHALYSEAITLLYQSMDLISDGAIDLDADLLNQGTELMIEGSSRMEDAAAEVAVSAVACGA